MTFKVAFSPLSQQISRLVLGTVPFGSWTQPQVDRLLDGWVDAGGNVVDCANSYGRGASEARLGSWLSRRGARDQLVIITKGGNSVDGIRRMTPAALSADLDESRARLQISEVDLYMPHKDDPLVSPAPVLEWLNQAKESEVIRAFGASNWTTSRLNLSFEIAASAGLEPFCCSSPNLSLARQHAAPFSDTVSAGHPAERSWYEAMQLSLFAWSAQAGGFFTKGQITSPSPDLDARIIRAYHTVDNFERRARAIELASDKGVDANELALAWVLQQPFPTFAIVGPQTMSELHSCIAATAIELTPEEVAWLEHGLNEEEPSRRDKEKPGVSSQEESDTLRILER